MAKKLKPLKFLAGVIKQVLFGATAAVLSRPDPTRLEKLSGKMRWRGNWRRRIFRENMSKNNFSFKVTLKNFWRQLIVEIRTMRIAAQLAEMSLRHQMSAVRIPTSAKLSNVSVNLSMERKEKTKIKNKWPFCKSYESCPKRAFVGGQNSSLVRI